MQAFRDPNAAHSSFAAIMVMTVAAHACTVPPLVRQPVGPESTEPRGYYRPQCEPTWNIDPLWGGEPRLTPPPRFYWCTSLELLASGFDGSEASPRRYEYGTGFPQV